MWAARTHREAMAGLGLTLSLLGCAPHSVPCSCEPVRTHRYVISVLRIPPADGEVAFGVDLDGVSSAGDGASCVHAEADFFSATDGHQDGVDNALAALVPALDAAVGGVDATLAAQIADGSLLIVVDVGGIESYRNDSTITLRIYRGTVMEGVPLMLEPDGTLSPGQQFDLEPLGPERPGSIVNGRIRATFDALDIEVGAGASAIPLTLHDLQVRGNITQTTLVDGVIGGGIDVADLERVEALAGMVVGDLEPDPADDTTCRAVSAGLSFTAIDHVDDFDDPR